MSYDYNNASYIWHATTEHSRLSDALSLIGRWKEFNPNYGALNVYICRCCLGKYMAMFITNPMMGYEASKCPTCGRLSRESVRP